MIKASAIYLVLVVSLIIAALSSTVILYTYYTNFHLLQLQNQRTSLANASSGAILLLSGTGLNEGVQIIDLYGEGNDSIELSKKKWGIFDLGIVKAFRGKATAKKMFLSGKKMNEPALYLPDYTYPLSISGNTVLKGDCYLPRAGIKRGNLHGQNFTGKRYVEGQTFVSSFSLPELSEERIQYLKNLFILSNSDYKTAENGEHASNNSFADTTILVHSQGPLMLSGNYEGNFLILSQTSVEISSSANLKDVIVVAPFIRIHDNFKGSGQFIASDSLLIGQNCEFAYPSAAGIISKAASGKITPTIRMEERTRLSGELFSVTEKGSLNQPLIKIFPGVIIHGAVLSYGYLELRGIVEGSVVTNKFILTGSSVHENHLLNAVIDRPARAEEYVGGLLRKEEENNEIVKWLE